MELKQCPKCYTDICVNGKWFHHDHLTTNAYMLNGSEPINVELAKVPTTENELINMLNSQF
ncbi:hypothetical protein ACFOD0_00410 [Shewanella intestini]|uniref:Uncharacterized protein n=1 Tax=Shewanella intestini TaxID=2017544 RepID=A0ABS5HZ18_9GAMM|nr:MULTISPECIES: hypothetical protein [Shewanella]MBR9727033.1 hypothetical protein [Shewanella intestini]MRG35834.1 hypothetical protein [Shewanella sp. XMDDZSB0408]